MRARIIDGPHEGEWVEFVAVPDMTIQRRRRIPLPFDEARRVAPDGRFSFTLATIAYQTEVYHLGYCCTRIDRDPDTGLLRVGEYVFWYRWRANPFALDGIARTDPARWFAPTGKEGA